MSWNKGKTKINWNLEKDNIKKLLDAGKTFKEIADKYKVGANTIWRGAKEYNLKDNFKTPEKRNRWTSDEIDLIRKYLNNNESIESITKALNGKHSELSVRTLIQKRGDDYGFNYKPTRHYPTSEEIEKIKQLTNDGLSCATIAKELNLGEGSVSNVIEKSGLTKSYKRDGFFRNHINPFLTEESLYKLYIIEDKTTLEISKIAEVSVDTIRRRIRKLNIQKPKKIKEKSISKTTKHIIEILTNYLGHEPSEEMINKPFKDIFKKEDLEKVYKDNNYSIKLSAETLKLSVSCFDNLLKYNNIPHYHRTSPSDFSEEFYTKCIEAGMSYFDISEQIGLSPETIRKYIGKNFPELKIRGEYVSSGENMVATVLKSFNINFKYDNLFYIDNNKIYIDFSFTLDNQEYWIEYNGKQHYEFVEYFFKTQERFEKQLERDAIVRKYAKDNNIILVELKYCDFTTTNKISDYLKTILPANICQIEILTIDENNSVVYKDILEKFEKSDYNKSLIYIFDSNDGTIITTREAREKYNISETSARRWSLEGKHGLISIYNPRINKTK